MKRLIPLLLTLCVAAGAAAKTYGVRDIPDVQRADRTRYVSDPDGILSAAAVARIDSVCASLRERNIAQVAVVAVGDIEGGDVFGFAIALFGSWGGGRGDRDNGVGILLVRDRREIRIVTGDGAEGVLPDAVVKRIQMKYMLPYFREGDYSAGMTAGVEALARRLEGSELDLGGTDAASGGAMPAWAILVIVLGCVAVPLGASVWGYYRRKRCPRCHRYTLGLRSQEVVRSTPACKVIEYTFVCTNCGEVVRRQVRSERDNHLGGPGGGVFMGGGFGGFGGGGGTGGGFGGGHFGGGGAGSRW